eukprot:3527896-Rhodomonas_salina.3
MECDGLNRWFLHLAGRAKESAAVLKKGLALHPSDPAMHFHRGMRGVSKTFLPLGCDVRHSEILMVQRAGKALYDMASPAAAVSIASEAALLRLVRVRADANGWARGKEQGRKSGSERGKQGGARERGSEEVRKERGNGRGWT